jgi:hypothetical protein
MDFGSEPVTDGMDNLRNDGGKQFIKDLGLFRQKANSRGIPAGISEEWDRPNDMVSISPSQGQAMYLFGRWISLIRYR